VIAAAPPVQAALVSCDRMARVATFEGRASLVAGAERIGMRFVLQARASSAARWRRVRVPGFSTWHTSAAGRERYVYTKQVEGLVGPRSYRVRVFFRWLDGEGDVIRRARAASSACREPDLRPDLRVAAIAVRRDHAHFAVTVRNTGRTDADPTRVDLDLGDGGPPLSAPVPTIAAGGQRTVVLAGRACTSGAVLTATADSTDAVEERDESDDALVATCP
jgi:CARDB